MVVYVDRKEDGQFLGSLHPDDRYASTDPLLPHQPVRGVGFPCGTGNAAWDPFDISTSSVDLDS